MPWSKPYQPAKNQRLDAALYACADRVCFFTLRAYQDNNPFSRRDLSVLVLDVLRAEQVLSSGVVFTYCLMPDHLHVLLSPSRTGVSALTFVDRFKGRSTNRSWTVGWQGKLWQPRSYDHIVRAEEDLLAIANYILHNPVRKGLVDSLEEWPWCGNMNPLPL